MKRIKNEVKTCQVLLNEYEKKNSKPTNPQKLNFTDVEKNDVYNITAPFKQDNEDIIAGRVEARDSEHSRVIFFVQEGDNWVPKEGAPVFDLQDPFFTFIAGEIVIGGVEIYPHPGQEGAFVWRTVFYKGKDIFHLELFFKGPDGMKDLRLAELPDGQVIVLTRPQGENGGRGKIGFTKIAALEELTIDVVNNAPLLKGQFIDEEWGGGNEIHQLSSGLLGILGHVACFDEQENRHYYPMVFALNPGTGEISDMELIATRSQFLPGSTKRPDLVDVVFSGGLVRKEDGTADLYAGISDAEAHKITIQDPFQKFE